MKTNTFRFILLLIGVLGVANLLHGQTEPGGGAGIIGRMDSVEIRVFREDDLTTRGQLSENGTISMPLIGQVRLEGLSTDQAAQAITRRLADGYLVRPEVKVSIENRIRRTVTVLGQAQRPGVFELPAHRELTIVEAIGMAGGATRIANPKKISLKRGGKIYIVNLEAITRGDGKNIALRDGDVVSIPESLF
ncbi:MAG: polysaccharide biosynthesis/export family protein [Luteolibacter sp.]